MEILQTTDYTIFERDPNNRPTDLDHYHKLISAVEEKNLLHLFPIVVAREGDSDKLIVQDGQHRLSVAEHLHVPIYYVIDENNSIEPLDIARVNSSSKLWTIHDYLRFYSAHGLPDYLELRQISIDNPMIPLAPLARVAGIGVHPSYFRAGKFVITNRELLDDTIALANRLYEITGEKFCYSRYMFVALSYAVESPDVNVDRLVERVQNDRFSFFACPSTGASISMLEALYNKHLRYKIRIRE